MFILHSQHMFELENSNKNTRFPMMCIEITKPYKDKSESNGIGRTDYLPRLPKLPVIMLI